MLNGQQYMPRLRPYSEIERGRIDWLWPGRIAKGKMTLIAGDPGLGKSYLTLDIASRVSRGAQWPDGTPCTQGAVLLLSAEDGAEDTIKPRLEMLSADTRYVYELRDVSWMDGDFMIHRELVDLKMADVLKLVIGITQAQCLIVDPISAYLGKGTDSHKDADVRALLAPIAEVAEETNCAVVLVAHLNKGSDLSTIYRVSGSVAFVAAARTVWAVMRDPNRTERRIVACVKNNIGPDNWGLAYALDHDCLTGTPVAWEPVQLSSEDIERALKREDDDAKTDREEIREWLETTLRTRPQKVDDLRKDATAAGWAWGYVRRVKVELGVVTERNGTEFRWRLPEPSRDDNVSGWTEVI